MTFNLALHYLQHFLEITLGKGQLTIAVSLPVVLVLLVALTYWALAILPIGLAKLLAKRRVRTLRKRRR